MALRVADLETLFTANTDQVEKAEKQVKATGERIEKNPIKGKVDADATGALAGMDRVEQKAKQLVSAKTLLDVDMQIEKAERKTGRLEEELEGLKVQAAAGLDVTARTNRAEAELSKTQRTLDRLRTARTELELDADATAALEAMAKVEDGAKRLVSADVVTRIDADIDHAQRAVTRFSAELEVLRAKTPTVRVLADVEKAEAKLKESQSRLDDLHGARAVMEVDADTSAAEEAFDEAEDAAGESGEDSGSAFSASVIAALASIPIAGAVLGIGAAAGKLIVDEFQDALQIEVRQDRLQALTGIEEADAQRLARAAGEAYAGAFGESIEANMDTARLALQFDLIDADASTRDSQKVIAGLAGIAGVLDEDVRPTAQAVTTLLRTGMAQSADEAFDIIAAGARTGVNASEDMLDTLIEYPSILTRLGLSGEEMMGLLNQGLEKGARNSDFVADALKEFQIRATDASDSSAAGFARIGLNAEEMTAKIASGGEDAREGLQQVLEGLREIEDPVERNAAAVELFGTKAEDLGESLFALDLSSAVDSLDGVTGSAQRMFDTLADNDATKMEQAQRNIEVAADGIKGALAGAFADPLGDFADWVSQNRGPVLEFFSDLVNGAIDFGIAMIEGTADSTEAFGEFVSGPLASAVEGIRGLMKVINPLQDLSEIDGLIDDMKGFDESTSEAADSIRSLTGGLETARDKANEMLEPAVAMGYLNDASLELASSIDEVGYSADGAKLALEGIDVANLSASESGAALERQIQAATTALNDELAAAAQAGEGQAELTARYDEGRRALADQLQQMGLTEDQAWQLIDSYNSIPGEKRTTLKDNSVERKAEIEGLRIKIVQLPDKSVRVEADTRDAQRALDNFVTLNSGKRVQIATSWSGGQAMHDGGVLEFMAAGGLRGFTPMQPTAQMVPANSWRVVGDRGDVPEAYVPLDGSARSWGILLEALDRMPGGPTRMADGGVLGADRAHPREINVIVRVDARNRNLEIVGRQLGRAIEEELHGS